MNKYRIRFNKSRGQPGRGTVDHVWRVFEGDKEYLVKNVIFLVSSFSEKEENSEDWNIKFINTGLDNGTGNRIKQLQKYIKGDIFIFTYTKITRLSCLNAKVKYGWALV